MNEIVVDIPPQPWSSLAKFLHWAIVVLIVVAVPAGFVMSATYGPSFKDPHLLPLHTLAGQFHHTAGFLVLVGALVWVTRRVKLGRPAWGSMVPAWQRGIAALVQSALLALLLLLPLSGWAALSSLADSPQFGPTHIWFFGTDRWAPRIWEPLAFNDPAGYRRFASIHMAALWAGLGLFAFHATSALWHHFVQRDGVLRRMWPLAGK